MVFNINVGFFINSLPCYQCNCAVKQGKTNLSMFVYPCVFAA